MSNVQVFCAVFGILSATAFADLRCSEKNGVTPLPFPHPINCKEFYQCSNATAILFRCPGVLVFNPVMKKCSYPDKKICNETLDSIVPKENASEAVTIDPRCPPVNGEYPKYFVNPTNCSQFYECDNGSSFLFNCPSNLEFNSEKDVCDFAATANCTVQKKENLNLRLLNREIYGIPALSALSSSSSNSLSSVEYTPENLMCPEENGEIPMYFPNPINCKEFYQCSNARAFLFRCPGILEYNPVVMKCLNPDNKICDQSKNLISNLVVNEKALVAVPVDPRCPPKNGKYPTYFVNPKNSTQFYECDDGSSFLFNCPAKLEFNSNKNVCDFPAAVQKEQRLRKSLIKPRSSGDETYVSSSTNDESSFDDDLPLPPSSFGQNSNEGFNGDKHTQYYRLHSIHKPRPLPHHGRCKRQYFRNPKNCAQFYECSNGDNYLFDCPDGLHFNQHLNVCDWPENVSCH